MGITTRALFIESEYSDEIWNDPLPELQFLGYEYSPIPFDSQVLTDICWYEPLHSFVQKFNNNGLFQTLEDALKFKAAYDHAVLKGNIGDDTTSYICRVSEVSL